MLGNEEVRNIITAVGNGIGDEEDPGKRRYGKVVMMSDADVDGSHIRTLLMTFFFRQMPRLVAEGHLYVAQPPLYLVSHKKDRRYVQTEPAMQAILVERGLENARLQPAGDATTRPRGSAATGSGPCTTSSAGSTTRSAPSAAGTCRSAPSWPAPTPAAATRSSTACSRSTWSRTARTSTGSTPPRSSNRTARPTPRPADGDAEADGDEGRPGTGGPEAEAAGLADVTELHEVRTLNKSLARLRDEFGMRADVLLPVEVTGDDPPPRFVLHRDGEEHPLYDLRELVARVRQIGEKGIKITRFKGLGEMDAEQLWETTMDPTRRTLLQVRLDDAAAANDLFTTLMGDDVEPRREFIEKHALEVKNLDV